MPDVPELGIYGKDGPKPPIDSRDIWGVICIASVLGTGFILSL
jgi:hypothetical protein